jgi:hypothetical protein
MRIIIWKRTRIEKFWHIALFPLFLRNSYIKGDRFVKYTSRGYIYIIQKVGATHILGITFLELCLSEYSEWLILSVCQNWLVTKFQGQLWRWKLSVASH